MSIEKMREEFEAWHKKEVASFIAAGEVQAARHMQAFKETMLAVWEASRAALVIDLPDYLYTEKLGFSAYDANSVDRAIEAAGVKVKP